VPACLGARARVCTDLCVGTYYVGVCPCGRVSKCCTCALARASMDARACVSPHACMRQCVGGFSMTWCAGVRECGCVCMLPWHGTHVWASTCVCVCACAACTSTQLPAPDPASACALTRVGTDTGAHGDGRPTPINRCAPMHRSYLRMAGAHRPRCDGRAARFNRR
jgi:hypothetical protein